MPSIQLSFCAFEDPQALALETAWAVTPAPAGMSPLARKASLQVVGHGELNVPFCALLRPSLKTLPNLAPPMLTQASQL